MPEIERDDAQEARTTRRGVGGSARQRGDDQHDIDRGENGGGQHEAPIARGQRETEKGDGAHGHEQQAVIDHVERGPPAREHAEQGQARAQQKARDDHSLQPSSH